MNLTSPTDAEEPDAILSGCGSYRYTLRRRWASSPRYVLWIMLNPSTADATNNDATLRRCIRFSKDWGYGGLLVANLYGMRSPYPGDLASGGICPIGPENDAHIARLAHYAAMTICAWGQTGPIPGRRGDVLRLLRMAGAHWPGLHVLRLNQNGEPSHPLRLSATLKPVAWNPP